MATRKKWNEQEQGAKRRQFNQGTRGTARTQPAAQNPNKNTKSTDTNRNNSGRTAAAKPAAKAAPKAAPKQNKPSGVQKVQQKVTYFTNKNKPKQTTQQTSLNRLARQKGAAQVITGKQTPLPPKRATRMDQTLNPLEQMKTDAVLGRNNWISRATVPSKPLTAEERRKKTQQTAQRSGFNARARKQTLSSYDQKLPQGKRFQIQQAKQRWDEAAARGDRAGMEKAHKEAESLRFTAGYSGGAAGNQRIAPKLSQDNYNRLNSAGRLAMTQAQMTRDRAVTEDEIARADRRIEEILNAPGYRNDRLSAAETGKGWSYGPDGRRMWAGTQKQNREDAAQGAAGFRAVGEGVAGGLLYAGQTASRATRDKFERENIDKWIADEANYNQAKSRLEFIQDYKRQFGVVPDGYNEMQAQIDYNNAVQARAQLQRIRGDVDSLYFDPTVAERLGLPTTRDETLGERLLRQAAEDQAKATEGMNGVERFVTNALISTGQSVPGMALGLIPGVGPALGLGVLGAQAGGSRAYDLRQQGVTAEDAYRAGFISGGIEALTEKLPMEKFAQIIKGKSGKSALRNILEQAGLEGSEEAVSYVGNYIADVAQQNPDAHFSVLELLENAGMGAIGGAVFGTVGSILAPGHAVSPAGAQSEEIQEHARGAATQIEAVQDAETQIRTAAAQRLREDAQAYNEMVKAGVWSDAEKEMVKASLDQRYAEIAGQNAGQTSPAANQAPLTQVFEDGMQRNRGRAERAPAASVPTPLAVNETPVSVNPVEQAEQMTAEALRATDAEMARRDAVAQLQAETPPITYERSGLPPTSFLGAAIDARREARARAEAEAQVRRDQEAVRQNRVAAEQQAKTTNRPAEISTTIRRNEQAQVQQPVSRLEGLARTFGESGAASLRTIGGKMVTGQGAFVRDFTDVYNQVLGGRSENQVSRPSGMSDANYFAAVTAAQNDRQTGWDLDILKASKAAGRNVNAGVDWRDQYVRQMDRKTARTVDGLAKALGVKVVFAEKGSILTAGGAAANAEITGNVVRIEKGNPNPVRMLIGHELTHRMQDVSPETYRAFRDYAMSVPGSMDALERTVSRYQKAGAFRAQDNARQMAMDEVTADFAGDLLENSEQLQEFIRRNYENRTMLEVIRDFFRDLAAKLTGRQKAQADEAVRLLEEAIKGAEKSLKKSEREQTTASPAETAARVGVLLDEETNSAAPTLYSYGSWNRSEYVQDRDAAAKALAKQLKVTQKEAKRFIDSVNSVAKIIADDRARLDYRASPGQSAFVSNKEYGESIDFSTICKKRRLFTGTIDAIQRAMPDRVLMADEMLKIRAEMKKRGYEVGCGLCYVEGSRVKIGKYTKEFLDGLKAEGAEYIPTLAEMNTVEGQEDIRLNHPETYEKYVKFMNKLAQRKPKLFQMATEYQREILDAFEGKQYKVKEKNKNGGLRLQSFSDFEIIHLIDSMHVILDMSRVGLAGQSYTKQPEFARALGDTGLKINLSLIAKGVDENGKLIFDDVEGMPIKDAMELRDRYSKNVGTVIVVFNDQQLLAALADDRIDFVLPFHRSQWNKKQYDVLGLPKGTKDYTLQQNEKYILPVTHKNRNGKEVRERPANYMPNNYWNFNRSGKWNAEQYLKMCAENNRRPKFFKLLVNNGDGSYSLQPDGSTDGYWKLLIDFKMYDNEGKGSPQKPVRPEFNMDEAQKMLKDYEGGHENSPVAQDIVDDFVAGKRFSITPQADADYMAAVESGDMETAQRMVDEAAEKAGAYIDEDGNLVTMYHGSRGKYTTFNIEKMGDGSYGVGYYFALDKDKAKHFGSNVVDAYLMSARVASDETHIITADGIAKLREKYGLSVGDIGTLERYVGRNNDADLMRGIMRWATNGDKPYLEVVNDFRSILGVDALLWDGPGYITVYDDKIIKSADPVTYDDDGNVIPLSERFNAETGDIRYSIGTHDSEGYTLTRGQREYFKDSKVTDEDGNLIRVYHGTPAGGFTRFERTDDIGYFFTRSRSLAQTYSGGGDEFAPERIETWEDAQAMAEEYDLELFEENGGWTLKHRWGEEYFGPNDLDEAADSILKEVEGERMEYVGYLNLKNPMIVEGHESRWNNISGAEAPSDTLTLRAVGYGDHIHVRLEGVYGGRVLFDDDLSNYDDIRMALTDIFGETYLIDEMLEAIEEDLHGDEKHGFFDAKDYAMEIDVDQNDHPLPEGRRTREWVREAVYGGYDGVIFHDIIDEGGYGGSGEVADVYVALDSNQFKSVNNWNPTENEDIRYSLGTEGYDRARLMRENQQLKEKLDYWRGQVKKSDRTKTDPKEVRKLAKSLRADYSTEMDAGEITQRLQAIYDGIGKDWSYDRAYEEAGKLARDMIEQATATEDYLYAEYEPMRKFFKDTPLVVTPELKRAIPDYNEWRKARFGKLRLQSGDQTNIDQVFQEAAEKWPEWFNEEVSSNSLDQLERIAEVMGGIYSRDEINPFGDDIAGPAGYLTTQIMDSFWDVPSIKKTFADRAEARLGREVTRRLDMKERYENALQKVREQRDRKLKEQSERYLTEKRKRSQKQKERELRAKIVRHCGRLSAKLKSGTDKQHVPEVMQRIVATALDSINLGSGFTLVYDENGKAKRVKDGIGETTKRTEAFEELRKFYQQIITADPDEDLAGEMPEIISKIVVSDELPRMIDGIIGLRDTPIANLGKADLDKIWETVQAIETTISTYDKALGQARFETISEPAFAIQDYASPKKDRRNYAGGMKHVDRLLNVGMLKPIYFLYRLGDGGKMIWKMIEDAQNMNIRYLDEIRAYQEEHFKPGLAKRLEKQKHTFNFNGQEVELTTAQLINLYNLRKREQAEGHILEGGFRPDQIVKGIRDVTPAAPWHFTAEQIGEMLDVVARDAELVRIADAMMDGIKPQAVHGNAASMEVYGIKKYRERNYWPIESDENQTQTDIKNEAVSKTVAGSGFAKATQKGANNAVILRSAFDVYNDHVVGMAKYAAWLGPLENMRRILNFRYKDETGHFGGGVKEMLTKIIGKDGPGYYKKLMDDLNAGIKATSDNPFQQFIGSYKAAAIAGNIRVVAQQLTSIPRAMEEIDPQDFLLGMAQARPGQWENEIKKCAPIAIWKDWGYFTADTGRQMRNIFWGDDNILQTANNFIMNNRVFSPGAMDAIGWTAIWNALKSETKRTRKDLRPDSEEFMYAVRDRFNEVINKTQVVDGIPQRSQLMRSENDVTKMATSFMGEPTTTYNMWTFAVHEARTSEGAERGKAMRHLARTTFALATSIALNAAAQSLVDAVRDDDKDEEYWEKFFQAFFGLEGETRKDRIKSAILNGNLGAGMNPLTYIPFIKDVVSKRQGYKVTRMDMDIISRVMDSYDAVVKAMNGEGKKTRKNAWINFIAECSRFLGVPVANIKRDILSGMSTVFQATGNYRYQYELEKFLYNIEGTGNFSEFAKLAYLAKRDGDTEAYEAIRADLIANGPKSEKDVDKKIAEFEKKAVTDTEEYQTALAQKTDAYQTMLEASPQYQEMDEELQGKVQDKLNSYAQYQVLGQSMEVDGSDFEKVQAAEASGVPAVDWAVLTVLKGSRNNYEENGKTIKVQDQMIETIDQMGGTDEEKSARYRTLYDSDKNNPWVKK